MNFDRIKRYYLIFRFKTEKRCSQILSRGRYKTNVIFLILDISFWGVGKVIKLKPTGFAKSYVQYRWARTLELGSFRMVNGRFAPNRVAFGILGGLPAANASIDMGVNIMFQ
jgi:hypothetical protein